MDEMLRVSLEKDISVSDIVHEAIREFLYYRNTGVNFFDIINSIEKSMNQTGHFIVNSDFNNFAVSIKSPLRYIYRPELKYEIKITQSDEITIGKISVTLRSRDIDTLKSFSDFVSLWIDLETKYSAHKKGGRIEYIIDIGYFGRKIYLPVMGENAESNGINSRTVGASVGDYVNAFDELYKYYYSHSENGWREIENMYAGYAKAGKFKI